MSKNAGFLRSRAKTRYLAKASSDKKYINIYGGAYDDKNHGHVMRELAMAGFEGLDRVSLVPGPFLRSTDAAGRCVSHMPIVPQSLGETIVMLSKAHELTKDGDKDLNLEGRDFAVWGHHSDRRLADTQSRRDRSKTGATEEEIDLNFGWNEAMHGAKMQNYYEQSFTRERRCALTSLL